mmetsp:Transcript_2401/g.7427  ORF Transcript_2401/g.7427 Transcript_2401/m.7427 type:complete len:80 (+) Transcript_2401:324-563(+)
MFAIDRRIMDEEIGNWKNQAFLAHHRAGVALRDYRSKMTRSEGQRLTRGAWRKRVAHHLTRHHRQIFGARFRISVSRSG